MRNQLTNQMGHVLYSYLGGWWQRIGLIACVIMWCVSAYFAFDFSHLTRTLPPDVPGRVVEGGGYFRLQVEGGIKHPLTRDMLSELPEETARVSLMGREFNDDDLVHLKRLKSLYEVILYQTSVTDDGLKHLSGSTSLQALQIYDQPITDQGIRHLLPLTKLFYLDLRKTNVSDASIPMIKTFPKLTVLDLVRTNVTPDGISQIRDTGRDIHVLHNKGNKLKVSNGSSYNRSGQLFLNMYLLLGIYFCGSVIGTRVKQQFSDSRSKLIPNFRRPHLYAAVGLIVAVALINIILGIGSRGEPIAVVGFIGILLLFAVWVGAYPHSKLSFLPIVVVFGGLAFMKQLVPYFIDYWEGEYQTLSVTLAGCSVVGFYVQLRKIVIANEEDDDYAMPSWGEIIQVAWNKNRRPEMQRMIGRQINRSKITTWMVDRVFRIAKLQYHNGDTWARAKLYNVMGWQRVFFLACLFPLVALTQVPLYRVMSSKGVEGFHLGLLCVGPAFLVCCIEGGQMFQKRSYLRYEFLRPATRLELTNDITLSTLINVCWGLACNALWSLLFVGWLDSAKLTLFFLISFFVFDLLMVVIVVGVALWMGKVRKIWQYIVGIFAIEVIFGAAGWFFVYSQEEKSFSVLICGYTLMTLVGSALVATARQKWQQMEWG